MSSSIAITIFIVVLFLGCISNNDRLVHGLVLPRSPSVSKRIQPSVSYTPTGRVGMNKYNRIPYLYDRPIVSSIVSLRSSNNNNNNEDQLDKKFGGYTTRQRLREEVESPFRTVRLFFFGASTASALIALYFSILSVVKASTATTLVQQQAYAIPPPSLDESLQSFVINIIAVIVCGAITYRDWNAGEANLRRIAKGGALARLLVSPMDEDPLQQKQQIVPLSDYRRNARIVIAVGGTEYIETLNRSLNADQKSDQNIYAQKLEESDVIIVPVLLENQLVGNNKQLKVGDTRTCWIKTQPIDSDRNYNLQRSANVIAFPRGVRDWDSYLESELETTTKQNIDVINKGFIIVIKKNGRILRRATGQPPLKELVATMEVMDGSRFGMPGDDEIYPSNNNKNSKEESNSQETTTATTTK